MDELGVSASDTTSSPSSEGDLGLASAQGPYRRLFRAYRAHTLGMIAAAVIAGLILIAIIGPHIAPQSPDTIDLANRLQRSSSGHWLGTDDLGRDVFSRLLYATRTSLKAAFTAVVVATAIGLPAGLVSGYFKGAVDRFLVAIADVLMSVPYILLAMGIITALGTGLTNAMVAVGVAYSPRLYRLVRATSLEIGHQSYIEAALLSGTSRVRTLTRHVLPNIMSPLLVQITVMLNMAILAEASLSFLGLGVSPPDASWGLMLQRAFTTIRTDGWGTYWPGLMIVSATLSLSIAGDAIRDAMGGAQVPPPRRALREWERLRVR